MLHEKFLISCSRLTLLLLHVTKSINITATPRHSWIELKIINTACHKSIICFPKQFVAVDYYALFSLNMNITYRFMLAQSQYVLQIDSKAPTIVTVAALHSIYE